MPKHYCCVCLISLQPFLFSGDYPVFNWNRHSSLRLLSHPAVQSNSQRAFHSLILTPLPFKCSHWYDSWAETGTTFYVYVSVHIVIMCYVYVGNMHLHQKPADMLKSLLQMQSISVFVIPSLFIQAKSGGNEWWRENVRTEGYMHVHLHSFHPLFLSWTEHSTPSFLYMHTVMLGWLTNWFMEKSELLASIIQYNFRDVEK